MGLTKEKAVCLTIDCNSEPQSIVDWCSRYLKDLGLRATFFLPEARSHETVLREDHEVALLVRIDSIHEARERIQSARRAHPDARGLRFFGGLTDFRVTQIVRELGFSYLSTLFLPHPVPPFRQRNLLQFPVIFQDLSWTIMDLNPPPSLFDDLLSSDGVQTVLFHAGLLFHNVGSSANTRVIHEEAFVPPQGPRARGTQDVFLDFVRFCKARELAVVTCAEAVRKLADLRDLREMRPGAP